MNIPHEIFFNYIFLSAVVDIGFFLVTIFMHTTKKNGALVTLYLLQSFLLAIFLFYSAIKGGDKFLLYAALVTFAIKVVLTPAFFYRFIEKNKLFFASSTYLSTSVTLSVIFGLSIFSYSAVFQAPSFNAVSPAIGYAPLHLAGLLIAFFVTVNRKGAFAQIIGILTLENWVVYIAALTGFRQTFGLDLAVTFEIVVWLAIAITFILLLKRHFGTLDVVGLAHLKERE
jgi:hydrogenase-4 membrane subunit HyfE